MTPPIQRPETFLCRFVGFALSIGVVSLKSGIPTIWNFILLVLPIGILLSEGLERLHDLIRYRRYDEYYVDRRTGQVWWRSYFAPNPWDAGIAWVRMDMTESDVLKRMEKTDDA